MTLGIVYRRTIALPIVGSYAAMLLILFGATRWIEFAVLNR